MPAVPLVMELQRSHLMHRLSRRNWWLRFRGLAKCVPVLVIGALVAACAGEAPLKPAPSSRFIKAAPQIVTAKPEPKVVAKAPEPAKIRNYPEPEVLDGLSATKVHELLGAPGFKRSDDPAEIWQYRVSNCTLDLFMYETLDSEQRSVAHFETRPGPGQIISAKECFIAILQAAESGSQNS